MASWPHKAMSSDSPTSGNVFLSPIEWAEIQLHIKKQNDSLQKRDEEIDYLNKVISQLEERLAKSEETIKKMRPRAKISISDKPAVTSMEVEETTAPAASTWSGKAVISLSASDPPTTDQPVLPSTQDLNNEFTQVNPSKKSKKNKHTPENTPSVKVSVNTKNKTKKNTVNTTNNTPEDKSDTPTTASTSTKSSLPGVSQGRTSVKVPPIHITQKDNWPQICDLLSSAGAPVQRAKNLRDSICVKVDSIDAFRNARKILVENEVPFFSYSLPEDRPVKVVLRGIPEGISTEAVLSALREKGLPATSVQRLTRRQTKQPLPLVLVQLDRPAGNEIWKITNLLNLAISVETQRRGHKIGQCFRCQKFAHSARCCNVEPHCVKCGQQHLSKDCQKPRTEAAVCANCGGNHPANYRGCASFPKPKPKHPSRKQPQSENQSRPLPSNKIQPGKSFASAAGASDPKSNSGTTATPQIPYREIAAILGNPNISQLITGLTRVATKLNRASSDIEKLAILVQEFKAESN